VATDVCVLDEETILISHNEMKKTVENIKINDNVALLILDKNNAGVRIFGKAFYYNDGEYFDLVNKFFKKEATVPLGAILVKIDKVVEIK
jgi:uncharacterized pyridoxamine 5'-phosphate oxidase family protein